MNFVLSLIVAKGWNSKVCTYNSFSICILLYVKTQYYHSVYWSSLFFQEVACHVILSKNWWSFLNRSFLLFNFCFIYMYVYKLWCASLSIIEVFLYESYSFFHFSFLIHLKIVLVIICGLFEDQYFWWKWYLKNNVHVHSHDAWCT